MQNQCLLVLFAGLSLYSPREWPLVHTKLNKHHLNHRIYLVKQAILKGGTNISFRPFKMILPALELGLALGSGVVWMPYPHVCGFKAELIRQFPSP